VELQINGAYQEMFERDEDEIEREHGDESDLNTETVGAYSLQN